MAGAALAGCVEKCLVLPGLSNPAEVAKVVQEVKERRNTGEEIVISEISAAMTETAEIQLRCELK